MGANAQTSVPAFTAGQVLTAAQVTQINTGIPVFASSTERDAAFGGTGEKTLAEGQMAYLEDTDVTQVYDGSAWQPLAPGSGAYTDYSGTITFTNFTLGNGTVNFAYYTRLGDFVHYVGQVTLGSTSAFTGGISASLPVNANTRERASGLAEFIDSGVGAYRGAVQAGVTSTLMGFYVYNASATYATATGVTSTVPFTWTTNDIFAWTVIYRAA